MIMMTIRYDWPGDVPVTEWLTGSEQEVVILSADLFVDSKTLQVSFNAEELEGIFGYRE